MKKPSVNSSEFITIIGRAGAGVPVQKIEAILEFSPQTTAEKIFDKAMQEGKLIKTLVDKDKIRSIVILESGEVHPSTFHYTTLRDRVVPHIPLFTTIGCDLGGINGDKINLMIDYRYENIDDVVQELAQTKNIIPLYTEDNRTKTLLVMDTGSIYPSTFNYPTIDKRIREIKKRKEDSLK